MKSAFGVFLHLLATCAEVEGRCMYYMFEDMYNVYNSRENQKTVLTTAYVRLKTACFSSS